MEWYEIRVKSHLGPSCATAFGGFTLKHEPNGQTPLRGGIVDQAALHGVLMKIRDLGLTLIEVKCVDSQEGRPEWES